MATSISTWFRSNRSARTRWAPLTPFFFILTFVVPARAMDPYDVLAALLDRTQEARPLNSEDVPDLRPNDPQPLFEPDGDFDHDGSSDTAISGVYDLPKKRKYFVLVASEEKRGHFKKLFYEEFDQPAFLHAPGSTGEADPGNQAFSLTFCRDCADGWDFYWNPKRRTFDRVAWKPETKRQQKLVVTPAEEIPPEIVDKALKVAAQQADVQVFVSGVKKRNGALGTRVNAGKAKSVYDVLVFEKVGGKEKVYDRISVDVDSGKVVGREYRPLKKN